MEVFASAIAHPNVALVKYWGKTDWDRNIPAVGSISVTLANLTTHSTVQFQHGLAQDRLFINQAPAGRHQTLRVSRFLDEIRRRAGIDKFCDVHSVNNFPTGAGLASSASGFAALSLAASQAAGLNLDSTELSALARLGSGSAARSVFGGFVELTAGDKEGGEPAAFQLHDEHFWPLAVLVAVTTDAPKPFGSREAMAVTEARSPYYHSWVQTAAQDIEKMRSAIQRRDLQSLGETAEHSALKLHGLLMASRPGILYWNGGTFAAIEAVVRMRSEGLAAYFTIDAGPQVKVICRPQDAPAVSDRLQVLPGIIRVLPCRPGPAARLLEN
ncbi:MAG TPA: diphosphomevalonate decarboxylase [Desulfobacterales bacterium]